MDLSESEKRYLRLKVLSVFVMVSWRRRWWWPHISCPCLSGSGFSLLAVLLFTLLLTRTCLEFRISRFSSPLLAFRYRPLYYSSALTHTNFHNTLISQICPATQNSKCGCKFRLLWPLHFSRSTRSRCEIYVFFIISLTSFY